MAPSDFEIPSEFLVVYIATGLSIGLIIATIVKIVLQIRKDAKYINILLLMFSLSLFMSSILYLVFKLVRLTEYNNRDYGADEVMIFSLRYYVSL